MPYNGAMAKAKCTALTDDDVEALCTRLRGNDLRYAEDLDARQRDFLEAESGIKTWGEFKTVEELKRVMIGLHTKKTELSGTLEVRIVSYKDAG